MRAVKNWVVCHPTRWVDSWRSTTPPARRVPQTAPQRELLALAISIAIHCDGCIAYHTQAALENGATEEDILTVLDVAILMGGGPGVVYSTHALEALKQFKAAAVSGTGR